MKKLNVDEIMEVIDRTFPTSYKNRIDLRNELEKATKETETVRLEFMGMTGKVEISSFPPPNYYQVAIPINENEFGKIIFERMIDGDRSYVERKPIFKYVFQRFEFDTAKTEGKIHKDLVWLEELLERGKDKPEAVWNILTALRSSDENIGNISPYRLKHYTTERIRAIVGCSVHWETPYLINKHLLSEEEVITRNKYLSSVSEHFRIHFKKAINALIFLGYQVPENEKRFY